MSALHCRSTDPPHWLFIVQKHIMEVRQVKSMAVEHLRIHRCERCDRETTHVVESLGADNRPHYSCWDCVERHEKRFNQKPGWRRAHRTQRYQPVEES